MNCIVMPAEEAKALKNFLQTREPLSHHLQSLAAVATGMFGEEMKTNVTDELCNLEAAFRRLGLTTGVTL